MATILITTTDLETAGRLQSAFAPDDEVALVSDARDVRSVLQSPGIDEFGLILTGDVAGTTAKAISSEVLRSEGQVPIVGIFETSEPDAAGVAVDLGLDEGFRQPVEPYEVALVVRRLLQRKRLQSELGIVGKSEAIQEVVEWISQIAPVGSTVLITGESGTGKELVARGLHKLSRRRGNAFIAVNIAALPETLLESELFGHEKGAFTGASSLRKGMFELANGGTVFLDEIAEMPLGPQTRLLRVIEQREFMRVGGSESIKVDVRMIAATNRDLREAVELGEFRRDLYYRLNVLHIHMPPLRERREDIPLLVREFAHQLSLEHEREFKGIASDAMDILVRYDWPGNVRELRNLVESMVVLAPGSIIRSVDIPPEVRRGAARSLPTRVKAGPPAVSSRAGGEAEGSPARLPEMEFIFHTLVDLKFDIDDLRQEFERYKSRHPELTGAREAAFVEVPPPTAETDVDETAAVDSGGLESPPTQPEEDGGIYFRPGMTMQELERRAIIATLDSVGGNRRRAAAQLGIGERTLYRKLREYEIDA